MSHLDPNVAVALITTVGAILLALIGLMKRKLNQIHYEVKNSHSTNLRQDLDSVIQRQDKAALQSRDQNREIIGILKDHGTILEDHTVQLAAQGKRLDTLYDRG